MRLRRLPGNSAVFAVKNELHSGQFPNSAQGDSKLKMCGEEFMCNFLNRKWTLINPDTKIHQIMVSETQKHQNSGVFGDISFSNNLQPSLGDGMMGKKNDQQSSFYIVRDDLLHPLVNGNKARKLDGLFPLLEDHCIRDVVTCGGCQSAHAAAVAVSCAERGLKSHLLLRGEQPETLTGYNLVSMLYGNVSYVPRSLYAKRQEMLARHAYLVAGTCGSVLWLKDLLEASNDHTSGEPGMDNMKKVVIVNEGAGDAVGLLGVLRLVHYLSQNHSFGKKQALKVIIDAGTGTTAVGLGLGAMFLGLPWEITAVMLADSVDGYRKHEERLISEFFCHFSFPLKDQILSRVNGGIVRWVERQSPRKFGKVLKGEVEACQHIARQTGVSVDPIYTLAAWELATQLSQQQQEARGGDAKVVMLHTGGTLGMFGLAQRYKLYFQTAHNQQALAQTERQAHLF